MASDGGTGIINVTMAIPGTEDHTNMILVVIGVAGGVAGISLAALVYLCRERITTRGAKSLLVCTEDREPRPQSIDSETSGARSTTVQPNSIPLTHIIYPETAEQEYAMVRESFMVQGPILATAPTLPRGHPRSERTLSGSKQPRPGESPFSPDRRARSTDFLSSMSGPMLPSRLYRNAAGCPGLVLEDDRLEVAGAPSFATLPTESQRVKRLSRSLHECRDDQLNDDVVVIQPPQARYSSHFDVFYDNPKYEGFHSTAGNLQDAGVSQQPRQGASANAQDSRLAIYSSPRQKNAIKDSEYELACAVITGQGPVLAEPNCTEACPVNPFAPSGFNKTVPLCPATPGDTTANSGYEDAFDVMKESLHLLPDSRKATRRQQESSSGCIGYPGDSSGIYLLAKSDDDGEPQPEDIQRSSASLSDVQPQPFGNDTHDRDNQASSLGSKPKPACYEYHTPSDVVHRPDSFDDGSDTDDRQRTDAEFSTDPVSSPNPVPHSVVEAQSLFGGDITRGVCSPATLLVSIMAPHLPELVPGLGNDVTLADVIPGDEYDSDSSLATEDDDYGMSCDDDYVTGELTIRLARGEISLDACPSEEEDV